MKPRYNKIPTELSKKEFDEFIFPHLKEGIRGPKPKISLFKMFNYILHLIHTGCQWYKLPIDKNPHGKPEISFTRLFRHFKRWVNLGCFDRIFEASVARLLENKLLDTSIIHGDGTTTAAKKGATTLDLVATNISKEIRLLLFVIETVMLSRHLSQGLVIKMNPR